MAAPQDPNRIDVSLNIMSDATLQAVNSLTQQMSGLREFLASQQQVGDPGARAEGLSRAASYVQTAYTTGQVPPNRPTGPIQTGDPANPSAGAKTSAERRAELQAEYRSYMESFKGSGVPGFELSKPAERLMAHEVSDWSRWRLAGQEKRAGLIGNRMDRFFALYQGAQRDPGEDRAYEDEAMIPRTGGSALPEGMGYPSRGPSSSSPMSEFGDMPGWAQTLQREGISPESRLGLTIPRLGEFTIQDKFNMAAQWMGRAAQRRGTYNEETGLTEFGPAASRVGRTAASAAYLRDQSASIVAIQREWQRVRDFARGEEQSAESLGFSRESFTGDIEAFGIGLRPGLPGFSEASREALGQEFTQRRIQAAAGVSGEEAQRIRQTVAGMGYSGDLNRNLQYNLFKPLQQRGIAPEAVAPLIDQGVRQGNMSIASLRDTMIDLADAARNANMTLEDTTAAALEYSESVQEIGANYEASLRNAATFTRMGLDPRIAGEAMQSPMIQGIMSMQTGLPPQLQGIVGAPGVTRAMSTAIQQGLGLGSAFLNQPDRTVPSASGQEITVSTGRDAQIAMAQQVTGLPRQVIERSMDNPEWLETGGIAQTMVGQMQDQIRGATQRSREVTEREGAMGRAARPGSSRMVTRTEGYTKELTNEQRQALEHGSTSDTVISYDELEKQMLAMGSNKDWQDRVRKIRKDHGNIEDRIKVAQRIIGEATNVKPEPDYLVGLTAEAAKILKIVKPKDRDAALPKANAGGAPANAAMQGPGFPSNSGGAMSYGMPGGP